jgi:predicted enzyme related to lactoylglutathione lyase
MAENNRIDLIELRAPDAQAVRAARAFYESAFGWSFASYGDEYIDTRDSGLTLGVNGTADATQQRAPLTVLYASDLEDAREKVTDAGGTILHDIYGFPGGRRFHFVDPAGNELAVWSEDASAEG